MISYGMAEKDFQIQSSSQPPNRVGFISTIHFTYNGQDFEFSTPEPESNKKKAEHKVADMCINALEAKFQTKIRPDEQNKSSLAQICGYGLTDEKNPDSIQLFHLNLGEKEYLPLGTLLYIKNIRSAVNREEYHEATIKSPHTMYKILEDELGSSRNVMRKKNNSEPEPLVYMRKYGIQTVVKLNPEILSSKQRSDIVAYTKKKAMEVEEENSVHLPAVEYLRVVFIPSKVPTFSSCASEASSQIVITETEVARGNCLQTMEEMRRILRTNNMTMSSPYKLMTPRTQQPRKNQQRSLSSVDVKSHKFEETHSSAVKSSIDSLATQYSEIKLSDESGVEATSSSSNTNEHNSNGNGHNDSVKEETNDNIGGDISSSTPMVESWRQKKGPRFFLPADPTGLTKNELVSWITGSPCYGDAIFAFLEPTEIRDVNTEHLLNLIASFTPIGLLSSESPIFSIPTHYSTENFERMGLHAPMAVLSEIISKRTSLNGIVCKPEIQYTQKNIEPFESYISGKEELGEGEYTLLRPIQTFRASIRLPSMATLDFNQIDCIYNSDDRPNKQDATQAAALMALDIIQQNCDDILNKIHVLMKNEEDEATLLHYPYRSKIDMDDHTSNSLKEVPRCFLADITISYVVSNGYEYDIPITSEEVDYDTESEYGDGDILQPNLSIFEIPTKNEKILGADAIDIECNDILVGIGNLPLGIEMGLLSVPEEPPLKVAVGPIQIPPWWRVTTQHEKSSTSLQQTIVPAKSLSSLSDILSSAQVVDVTLKAVLRVVEKKSPEHHFDSLSDMKREASVRIFEIPLSLQRYVYISNELKSITSLVDVGCGGGDYFLNLMNSSNDMYLPSLTHMSGFDVNETRVKKLQDAVHANFHVSPSVQSIQLWKGSVLERPFLDTLRASMDVTDLNGVVCIEVIEHLPSIEDARKAAVNVLSSLQPRIAIFTTPNYEANSVLASAAKSTPGKNDKGIKFREADHKFEFTRKECLTWIHTVLSSLNDLCSSLEYTFETFEIGDLSKYNGGKTCGGATQGVKFTRCSESMLSTASSRSVTETFVPLMNWKKDSL